MNPFQQCSRRLLLQVLIASSLLAGLLNCQAPRQDASRPNLLFILADDQRFDTISALGNPDIVTPNLDRLVEAGTTFSHAYIMGGTSAAVCAPSRAMLLTGRTLFHIESQGEWRYEIPASQETIPETFRRAGYVTFATGKQHNGREVVARGFTNGSKLFFGGMSDHYAVPDQPFDPAGEYPEDAISPVQGCHSSELFTDAAVEFLRDQDGSRPFFAYVSYTAPHDPRTAPEEVRAAYDPDSLQLPPNLLPRHPFDNGELEIRDEQLAPWPRTRGEIRCHLADYYAMITHLDREIGRLLQTLSETGLLENTIVVFTGDNGLAVGQHGLLGKQNLYEHSIRVPLIFSGPGIPPGEARSDLVYLYDLYPTLCELTGLEVPATVEGSSLATVIGLEEPLNRDSLFFAYRSFQRAVRKGPWKLIRYRVGDFRKTQLFNLETDPWETEDLARDPAHERRIQELEAELSGWALRLEDPERERFITGDE